MLCNQRVGIGAGRRADVPGYLPPLSYRRY